MDYHWQPIHSPIVQVDWLPFRIPYVAAFTTAHGQATVRAGAIVRVGLANGLVGLGEAAPLPEFGGGTLDDTLAAVAQIARWLPGKFLAEAAALLDGLAIELPGMSAALCGFDTALLDVAAQAAGLPLARFLTMAAVRSVPVNATVGAADTNTACRIAAEAVQAGFGTVKLKVGVAATPSAELARIAAVRAAIGEDAQLRLDANGAWEVEAAIAIIRAAEAYGIQLVEQPVAPHDLAGMATVRAAVHTPIAADEAAGTPKQAAAVLAAGAADTLVVKPMMAGGLRRGCEIIARAQAAHVQTLVTTTIDAGVGVAAALHLAATLPTMPFACGLATGGLLASDLLMHPIDIRNGTAILPELPGLGVRLDDRQLARYAGVWQPHTA